MLIIKHRLALTLHWATQFQHNIKQETVEEGVRMSVRNLSADCNLGSWGSTTLLQLEQGRLECCVHKTRMKQLGWEFLK